MSEVLPADNPVESIGYDRKAALEAYRRRRAGLVAIEQAATLIGPTDARELKGCPLAVIDVETTGRDALNGYVVEIAVIHHEIGSDADPVVAFRSYVRPPLPIPSESTKITGISDDTVKDAPPFAAVINAVIEACDGRLVVAHNAPFDYGFVREEFRRAKRTPLTWPWLDTFVLRKELRPKARPGKLGEIAAEYGMALSAHGAAGDALVTAMLVTPMLRELYHHVVEAAGEWDDDPEATEAKRVSITIARLLGWQRDVALEQEREFCRYAQRAGWTTPPSCGWHALEGVEAPPFKVPPPKASRCSSCGAAIIWAATKTGAKTPLNADPVAVVIVADPQIAPEIVGRHIVPPGETAPVQLVSGFTAAVEHVSGYLVPAELRPDLARTLVRVSHFSTCPQAATHRKEKAS